VTDEHYVRCVDPECPDAYAYRAPFPDGEHWHYTGPPAPEPERWADLRPPVCVICDAPGAILCEQHR
jgi:hypothetical protein